MVEVPLPSLGDSDDSRTKPIESNIERTTSNQVHVQPQGYCYLNKEGIDHLALDLTTAQRRSLSYPELLVAIYQNLRAKDKLAETPWIQRERYVVTTCHLTYELDDKSHILFRSEEYGFKVSMSKAKSTLCRPGDELGLLSHERIALLGGVDMEIFGEWYSSDYLRPHAARVVGRNFGDRNTLR